MVVTLAKGQEPLSSCLGEASRAADSMVCMAVAFAAKLSATDGSVCSCAAQSSCMVSRHCFTSQPSCCCLPLESIAFVLVRQVHLCMKMCWREVEECALKCTC